MSRYALGASPANILLTEHMKVAHAMSDATSGMPRIRAELADMGVVASRKYIAGHRRQARVAGVSYRRAWCITTQRNKRVRLAPDLVKHPFVATDINPLWVATIAKRPAQNATGCQARYCWDNRDGLDSINRR